MPKLKLTDKYVQNLRAPEKGRAMHYDALVPGLAVLVTEKEARSWVLYTRYPGTGAPARRTLGTIGQLTLAEAREKARGWLAQIERGVDPREASRRAREEETRKRDTTVGAIMEEFFGRHVQGKRKAADVEREIRRELLPRWGDRAVTDITRRDVVALIDEIVDRGAKYQAHNVLGHVRTFFNWAINWGIYGLEVSPCDRLKPGKLIGAKEPRQRVLTNEEIAGLWRAAEGMGYPFGDMYRLLVLTGQRRAEVAEARWREFDLEKKLWTIPPERFKSNAAHVVPLTDNVIMLLEGLPRFAGGDCLFTTTSGRKPVNSFSRAKKRLDRLMAKELGSAPPPWVVHDIRRTVRTRLSELRILDNVAERVIGHAPKGLQRVYDQHRYLNEMREALEAWEARLRTIVDPPPSNVVPLRAVP